jgi:hypothetical protein
MLPLLYVIVTLNYTVVGTWEVLVKVRPHQTALFSSRDSLSNL